MKAITVKSMYSNDDAHKFNPNIPASLDSKERTGTMIVVARLRNGDLADVITLRDYMGKSRNASTRYATIFIHAQQPGYWAHGYGTASGYGYCKRSAAAGAAIQSAGIQLDASISGIGESGMREALGAIARKLGYRKFIIVEG